MTPPGKSGRPAKADLSPDEWQEILPGLSQPRQTHGSSLEVAAAKVSRMRGALTALDPRTVASRKVSGAWIGIQLRKRGIAGRTGLQQKPQAGNEKPDSKTNSEPLCDTGPRLAKPETLTNEQPPQPFKVEAVIVNHPPTEAAAPFAEGVESERKEATA